jgi:hypothetical protein
MRDLLAGSIVWLSAIEWWLLIKEFFAKSKKEWQLQSASTTPRW